MNITNFSKEELTNIEEFLKEATIINNIYDKLYKLETNGLKDSNEYQRLLQMLKEAIKIENQKYKTANLTYNQCMKIIELLSNTPNTLKMDNITCIIRQKENDKIIKRIINILLKKAVTNIEYTKSSIPSEVLEELSDMGIPIDEEQAYNDFNNDTKVQIAINNDIIVIFLSILENLLNDYPDYKNQLLKIKYNTIFTHKDTEELLIKNNLNSFSTVYISSRFLNDLLKSSPTTHNIIKSIEISLKIDTQIRKILNIKDEDYENESINISLIISQCYLRALLSLMDEEEIQNLKEQFYTLIESPAYIETHPNNKKNESIIINCFKKLKQDKERIRTLTINNRPQ